jgi:hypothetical protein
VTTEPFNLPLLFRALQFAADHHRDDRRRDIDVSPYINHPIGVAAELVAANVEDPEIIAAALLHDTIEDTLATPEDLEREFGARVCRLVLAVTDDKSLDRDERRRLQVERAPALEPDAKLIKIADKIYNARDVAHSPPTGWSLADRMAYIDQGERVVAGCRGVNAVLEARYDEVLRDARSQLALRVAATGGLRVIAVDWSGARSGAQKHIRLAEVQDGRLVRLEGGRSREEVVRHLVEEAGRDPELIVGLDFAFSFPEWFGRQRGADDVRALWELVEREGEHWLRDCPDPFWGRPGRKTPAKEILPEPFRRTDLEAPAVGSSRPKSVFQIGGAGAVGTGSIRGMPFLGRLADAGFSIWPFDPVRLPALIEIYPRLLTGEVVKSRADARDEYLRRNHGGLSPAFRGLAASTEDAFDAAVSALVMWDHVEDLLSLRKAGDPTVQREGWIWAPGGER